ncbi:hypothetical protein [Brucella rhizosphaerae]|uniref:hypothetical protein n=1 Tax=Brucella rhizosphaerae TaxID=571254 RepID=UPI0036144AE4
MSISDAQFLKGWRQVLEMCNLKAGEQVTILTSDDSNKQIAYIAKLAASDLGAVVTELNLAPVNSDKAISPDKSGYIGKTPLDGNSAALACLKASDMVIDTLQLLFSKEQEQVLKTGTRMLLAVEPPAIMMRQIPRPEDKLRVLAAAKKIGAAKEMHVTSKAGTDFRCRLGQYPVLTQYGLADEPGRWDHWPSCFSARWPDEGSAEGTIVIDEGDILLPFKNTLALQSPLPLRKASSSISRAAMTPNSCASLWKASTIHGPMPWRMSAGDLRTVPIGPFWASIIRKHNWVWTHALLQVISFGRRVRIRKPVVIAIRPAISIFRCAIARFRSMAKS